MLVRKIMWVRLQGVFAAKLAVAMLGGVLVPTQTASALQVETRHAAAAAPHLERQGVGMVTGVADGDTLYVRFDGKSRRVRLADIDAPEKRQPFGHRAEQSLRELVWKKQVQLRWSETDRYGRRVVHVKAGDVDVNAEQVRRGFAWVYRAYTHDHNLMQLESSARKARSGLWSDAHAVPPWEWRHRKLDRP